MLGHLGLNVPDLAAAQAYYDRLVPLLDFEPFLAAADQIAYRPANGKRGTYLFLYPAARPDGYSREASGLQHLGFMVRTRGRVDEIHRAVAGWGGQVVHAPQVWPQYPPPYYATFWLDPFGFQLEAVCHYDAD